MSVKYLNKQAGGMAVAAAAFAVAARATRSLTERPDSAPPVSEAPEEVREKAGPLSQPTGQAREQAGNKLGIRRLAGALLIAVVIAAAVLVALQVVGRPAARATAQAAGGQVAITFDGSDSYARSATTSEAQPDPEAKYSHPETRKAARDHRVASMPAASTTTAPRAGTQDTAELRKQLRAARAAAGAGQVTLMPDGSAVAPLNAPDAVQRIVAAGNIIKDFPYIWGGGHGSFQDNGYDCSGSVSYALAGASLVTAPLVSGQLAEWGEPGPGKWLTVYANAGHVFMYVGGLRFDTSFRDGPRGSRWQTADRKMKGFAVRHWPGL